MFYICEHCHFVFSDERKPKRCPDCGEKMVRPATETEKAEHLRLVKIVASDNWDDTAERWCAQVCVADRGTRLSAR